MVNPYDVDGTAMAIYRAFTMPLEERKSSMRNLRQNVKNKDVFWWLNSFFNGAFEKDLPVLPLVDEYFPCNFVRHPKAWKS